ncbi:MAG: protein kinase [Candidatus Falkowbacteria bacterium]|nr:protein kinase [Candidatus Falkowbacteria bacterium]
MDNLEFPVENYEDKLSQFYKNNILSLNVKDGHEDVAGIIGGDINLNKEEIYSDGDTKVFVGYNKDTGDEVVVKEVNENPLAPRTLEERSEVEKYLLDSNFSHPAACLPLKIIEKDGQLIKIYPRAKGDLEEYLKENSKLPPKEALMIAISLSDVVEKLHQINVVHADIAPLNILIYDNGIKLSDFDDAYVSNFVKNKDGVNRFIMPPEFFKKGDQFDKTVDIYELGVNLYKFLSGKWPHEINEDGTTYEERQEKYRELQQNEKIEFPDSIPDAIRPIIEKAMSVDPKDRYPSARDLTNDLLKVYKTLE